MAVAVAVRAASEPVTLDNAQVCIVSSRKHKDKWVLPKGGVEMGESPREAARRELGEEGAYVLTSGNQRAYGAAAVAIFKRLCRR